MLIFFIGVYIILKAYNFQLNVLVYLFSASLNCSFGQDMKECEKVVLEERVFGGDDFISDVSSIKTPSTNLSSLSSPPVSYKRQKPSLSPLLLPKAVLSDSLQKNKEMEDLKRKINTFEINPRNAYLLGCQLLDMKKSCSEQSCFISELIVQLHNRVAMPLRDFFKNEKNEFDCEGYNNFLEKSLPRASDNIQETPLIEPNMNKMDHNPKREKKSVFDN